jgi:DNA-binding Lrp family transcriptional regulator
MKAYILINVRIGSITEVIHNLRKIDGIIEANMTFGPFDAVVVVKAESVNHLGRVIANDIHPIPGVKETITCLVTET